MARHTPRRRYVGARMSPEQEEAIATRAELEGVDASEVIRRALDAYLRLPTGDVRRHLADGLRSHVNDSIDQWKDVP